jgi:hypothetical protein
LDVSQLQPNFPLSRASKLNNYESIKNKIYIPHPDPRRPYANNTHTLAI